MSLFTNPNFIDHIVKAQSGQDKIDQLHFPTLQTFVELETRTVLESAIKFMRVARRDHLIFEDLLLAVKENNHSEMFLNAGHNYRRQNQQIVREDKIVISSEELMREQMKFLGGYKLQEPQLSGRWIYIKGKIPSISENIHMKSLTQLTSNKQHQQEQQKKLFSIIKDDPFSLLTKEQTDYFIKITSVIASNPNPVPKITADGDLNSLLPFFLKYLGENAPNQTGISFLLQLIDNKYIWAGLEYNLKKILNILIAYKGRQSYEVGVKIAQLVDRFCDKYPILRDLYVGYEDQSYSTLLKKIPFELQLGIPVQIDLKTLSKCKMQSQQNDQMAILCMRAFLSNSSQLSLFKNYLNKTMNTFVYWHPCPQLKEDPYLRMF